MKMHEALESTVDLTERETETKERFDFFRQVQHLSVVDSATEALAQHKGKPSKEFVEWLSEGALTKSDGEVTPAA